jgi:hypothetical protein
MRALAIALLERARVTLGALPEAARGPGLAGLDAFIANPAPSSFVAACRALSEARRRHLVASRPPARARPAITAAAAALRRVPALPGALSQRLAADLPADHRTGQRLFALAALARAYEELAGRVAADTAEMRQRFMQAAPRKKHPHAAPSRASSAGRTRR